MVGDVLLTPALPEFLFFAMPHGEKTPSNPSGIDVILVPAGLALE
jgi:hypothetical protein